MTNNNISVVLISDNNYAMSARVVCNSIIKNNTQKNKIEINIIGIEFSQENLEKFQQLDSELVTVKVIQTQNSLAHIANSHPHVSKAALQKFMIPEYFPNIDKILYLDCDVLVCENLTELFMMDVSISYAAVVKDMEGTVRQNQHLKMNHKDYFNSGMMLLNLKKIRENNVIKKMIEVKASKKFTDFMDQDEFNYVFAENVNYLSLKYNFMSPNLNYDLLDIARFYNLTLDELQQVYKQPTIIHLTNHPKTWNEIDNVNFKMWFDYLMPFDNYMLLLNHHNNNKKHISKLLDELSKIEAKATMAEQNANEANARATQAEQNSNEANIRATEAEAKATMAEQSANEANAKVIQAEAKATQAEQSANEAWQHYYMIEGSTSWNITKPLRLTGKFARWFVRGSYHWLTFSPTSRPRRTIKNLALKIKNYINSNSHYKEKVMFLLSFFPSLERRLVAIKDTSCHDDLDSFIILEFQNFILFFAKGPFEDNRGIGRVTREYYSYLSKKALQIHQKIDIKNQIKPLTYFYTSIHWCPKRLPYNSIVMVHDVIPLVLEEYFPEISKTWRETYKLVAQQASKIVTISQSSAYDIIKYLEIPKDKVDIVYNGVSLLPINKNSKVELPLEKYFVYIGAYDKHKNLDVVLHAMLNEKLNNCHLVLIGNNMEVLGISKKLKIEKRVHCLGRLDDSDVGFVLTHATGLVFPSLYEGFGLPPLEAALLKVPSICSKRPAMTELLEGSAIFVEPDNVQGWANSMNNLASNKDLRAEIGRKAYLKAREYEWMNSSNKLLDSLNIEMKRLDNVEL